MPHSPYAPGEEAYSGGPSAVSFADAPTGELPHGYDAEPTTLIPRIDAPSQGPTSPTPYNNRSGNESMDTQSTQFIPRTPGADPYQGGELNNEVERVPSYFPGSHGQVLRAFFDPRTGRQLSDYEIVSTPAPRGNSRSVDSNNGALDVHVHMSGSPAHMFAAAQAAHILVNGRPPMAHQVPMFGAPQFAGTPNFLPAVAFPVESQPVPRKVENAFASNAAESDIKSSQENLDDNQEAGTTWYKTPVGRKIVGLLVGVAIFAGAADVAEYAGQNVLDNIKANGAPWHWAHPKLKLYGNIFDPMKSW